MTAQPLGLAGHAVSHVGWHWLAPAVAMAAAASGVRQWTPGLAPADWTCFPRLAMRTPGTDTKSVGSARDFCLSTMRRWGVTDRGDDVAVVVSELLTNALRHGVPGAGLPAGGAPGGGAPGGGAPGGGAPGGGAPGGGRPPGPPGTAGRSVSGWSSRASSCCARWRTPAPGRPSPRILTTWPKAAAACTSSALSVTAGGGPSRPRRARSCGPCSRSASTGSHPTGAGSPRAARVRRAAQCERSHTDCLDVPGQGGGAGHATRGRTWRGRSGGAARRCHSRG